MKRINGRSRAAAVLVLIAGLALAALAGFALAHSHRTTLKTAHNSKLGETIVVSSKGATLYTLSGDTTHHLLCTTKACLQFWPPYTVSRHAKVTKPAGVKAKLGTIHRNGFTQVTLGGAPLYFFQGDSANGQANGEGIKSFGGTWHVIKAGKTTHHTATPTGTPMPYGY